jgi:hypothetical protein
MDDNWNSCSMDLSAINAKRGESAFDQKLHEEGAAILRVARELKEFLGAVPADDPQAQSLLRDCEKLERVGNWLGGVQAITLSNGIFASGSMDS